MTPAAAPAAVVLERPVTVRSQLPVPDLFAARRVLAIQPHYDDNDIGAGGTLALLADAGAELVYCTVTDDLVGVVDDALDERSAAAALLRDQEAAAASIGVGRLVHLGYPDAGAWDRFAVRADLLAVIRDVRPDAILTVDPWLPYEAHRDHRETGLVAAEAAILGGLPRLPSSRPEVDAAWAAAGGHHLRWVAFYHTAAPNTVVDVERAWERKAAAVSEYHAQFEDHELVELVRALEARARAIGDLAGGPLAGRRAEGLAVLDPAALHCGA